MLAQMYYGSVLQALRYQFRLLIGFKPVTFFA